MMPDTLIPPWLFWTSPLLLTICFYGLAWLRESWLTRRSRPRRRQISGVYNLDDPNKRRKLSRDLGRTKGWR